MLTSSDRLESESDLENELDLGEGEPAYRDAKYFVEPLKRRAAALSLGCSISSTASEITGLGLRQLEVSTLPMKGAL